MDAPRCPGQDPRYWKPEDILERECPGCGQAVEIWKDEAEVACPRCGRKVRNPRLDPGCARWCPHGPECGEGPQRPPDASK